ncbi:MAG: sensor histidine kinase [Rhodobacteraceae bacterium]|uniref:sensor histidine kinase n=1 Tax=Accumulibacter sp. TaxID=2053492 RepID=UPI0019E92AF4|nr:sensor histidine kinase [Accumulibacter sp.]MBE2259843.1 sensor histidine kinase [Paracoccaceae bacterium]
MNLLAARGSLRIRLLAGTLFWIAASIAIAAWGLGSLFREHVATQFNGELRTHLDQLTAHLAVDGQGHPTLAVPLSDPRLRLPYSGLYWQIDELGEGSAKAGVAAGAERAKQVAAGSLRSRSLWDSVLDVPPDAPADGEIHRHRVAGPADSMLGMVERVVRIDDPAAGLPRSFRLIVAADERLMVEPVARFDGALWLALGVLAAGLVVAALVQVSVGLAPLRKLHGALGRVRNGDAQTLVGKFPAEVMPLVDEFNSVLTQNAEVVERARTHAGNLAHALKTPLSVLANAATGKDDELARLVVTQVDTAKRQVDYHLARAQAAAAMRVPGARTTVRPVLEGLLRTMRRIHAGRQLELVLQPIAGDPAFRGEENDLQEMLGNLLDNACKWARSRVEVDARLEQGSLLIRVDDDGQGIAAADRDAVLRRGVRADQQVPGTGLGLSIADDLAQLYGGELALADSPLAGLRVVLRLPAAGSAVGG